MRVSGFTIVEMTVVMLITSLVVSFGYGGYLMMSKHYADKQTEHAALSDISRLRQVLQYECFMSDTVRWNKEETSLIFRENRTLKIEDSLAILSIGIKDTLRVVRSELAVKEIQLAGGEKVVSSVEVSVEYEDEEIKIRVDKEYADYVKNGF